jgi:hypothetical protein
VGRSTLSRGAWPAPWRAVDGRRDEIGWGSGYMSSSGSLKEVSEFGSKLGAAMRGHVRQESVKHG